MELTSSALSSQRAFLPIVQDHYDSDVVPCLIGYVTRLMLEFVTLYRMGCTSQCQAPGSRDAEQTIGKMCVRFLNLAKLPAERKKLTRFSRPFPSHRC